MQTEKKPEYHQITAFAAAKGCKTAYSVYDNGKQLIKRAAVIEGASEHRALLMAAWSAIHYCAAHFPTEWLDLYFADKRVPEELDAIWYGGGNPAAMEDNDRIMCIVDECCNVSSVTFGFISPDETGASADYARRIGELLKSLGL